jgi:hypothetical protein
MLPELQKPSLAYMKGENVEFPCGSDLLSEGTSNVMYGSVRI